MRVNVEEELSQLATNRERSLKEALIAIDLDPSLELRRLRAYLATLEDRKRVNRILETAVQLKTTEGGKQQLVSDDVEFASGSHLDFSLEMEECQTGWQMTRFKFHLHLSRSYAIDMVRIHLNSRSSWDALRVPRCHLHIGSGEREHFPFPIMTPLLILYTLCEVIEPDITLETAPTPRRRSRKR